MDHGQRTTDKTGFTLVELLVVMVIVSILVGFILNAAMGSVKRAQERQTQALITKLEGGLNDRLDALMQSRPDPNTAHIALAAVYNSTYYPNVNNPNNLGAMAGLLRAQTIAWYDYIKRELPDVFFVQNTTGPYPINFAANPYPVSGGRTTDPNGLGHYILPMGNSITGPVPGGNANVGPFYGDGSGTGYSANSVGGLAEYNPAGSGIYGASYPVAAGLYKNLGYLPTGYDGVDNNGDGQIDEWTEGVGYAPSFTADPATMQLVQANLASHKHATARAEMLYAILVEGRGPLGSVFSKDDFTDREVQDTDGDGLPEFVDAWGHPLQFFRWPLLYHSDVQRGQVVQAASENSWILEPPYQTVYQEREQDPLDLNQQLMAPAWWSSNNNDRGFANAGYMTPSLSLGASGAAQAFEYYFHRLTEPYGNDGAVPQNFWARGPSFNHRRAFYSKFLIVSGGLDEQLGVFLYSDEAIQNYGQNAAWPLIANENLALPFSVGQPPGGARPSMDFKDFTQTSSYGTAPTLQYRPSSDPTTPSSSDLLQAAQDDISNQNIQTTVGIGGGG